MPELSMPAARAGHIADLVRAEIDPVLDMVVDDSWARATVTRAGVRNTGRSAREIVEQLRRWIQHCVLELAARTRDAAAVGAQSELVGRPPTRVADLVRIGDEEMKEDVVRVLFNETLRYAPAMVLAKRAARSRSDVKLLGLCLCTVADHRDADASRNALPHLWKRARCAARAQGLALVVSGTLTGRPFHVVVGFELLRNPDARAHGDEREIAAAAKRLLDDYATSRGRLAAREDHDAAVLLRSLPIVIRHLHYGYATRKRRAPVRLSGVLTPGMSSELVDVVARAVPGAAFALQPAPFGTEVASGRLSVGPAGISGQLDARGLWEIAESLARLDPASRAAHELCAAYELDDVSIDALGAAPVGQWLRTPQAIVRAGRRSAGGIPAIRLARPARASLWLLAGHAPDRALAAAERQQSQPFTDSLRDCIDRRYRLRVCLALRLHAGAHPEMARGLEAASQLASVTYIIAALGHDG